MTKFHILGEMTAASAKDLLESLALGGVDTIILSSCGGDVDLAPALCDPLLPAELTIVATGRISSAAPILLIAGARRFATPLCRFMSHPLELEPAGSGSHDTDRAELITTTAAIRGIFLEPLRYPPLQVHGQTRIHFGITEPTECEFVQGLWPVQAPAELAERKAA